MPHYYTATVLGARADEFRAVFGSDTVPIKSAVPEKKLDEQTGEFVDVFLLDVGSLTLPQREKLIHHWQRQLPWLDRVMAEQIITTTMLALPASECVVQAYLPLFLN